MDMSQQFCLKWNNHHSNLLSVFEALLHTEAFTDVTLAVDGASIKCHKMVLAACSPYLQTLLAEHVTTHPIVVLKDIRLHEMRALLEYMYRGEVNVAQEQLASLLKVAETLQIKGLVEDGRWDRERGGGAVTERATIEPRQPCPDSNRRSPEPTPPPPLALPAKPPSQPPEHHPPPPPPPPLPPHPHPPHPLHPAAVAAAAAAAELQKKKQQQQGQQQSQQQQQQQQQGRRPSEVWCESNPILRTVLGHGGMSGLDVPSLMAAAMGRDIIDREYADRQVMSSTGSEESHGPPGTPNSEPDVEKMSNGSIGEMPPHWDSNLSGYMNSFINFAPTPMRPEWKRYKQYSKSDLQQALDAVKGGMTALQASRKFHVPSRTLYDKIKKLGIPTMPRRYPRSVGAVPASPLPVYPPVVPPPPDEDDSAVSTQQRPRPTNGDTSDVQRQPLELVVERRRHSSGGGGGGGGGGERGERELGEDGVKRPKDEADDSRELDVVA